jgi:hypothetical protein
VLIYYVDPVKQLAFYLFLFISFLSFTSINPEVGAVIDSYNGVPVYYNGKDFKKVQGRNMTPDGYNLGLKYQCVEFVKRYYYEVYGHKMPNSYGHAKDFYDDSLGDVGFNQARGMWQYTNVREEMPQVDDILVYGPHTGNPFGHVALITKVEDNFIELVHQNKGTKSRQKIKLVKFMDYITIADYNIKCWLRLKSE